MSPRLQEDALVRELLGPLHGHFRAAKAAYADYLGHGKAFRFARRLKRENLAARRLLVDRGHRLPEALRTHAAALIGHYDVWLGLWDELAARTAPGPDDPFAFENAVTYPREAEEALTAYYRSLGG